MPIIKGAASEFTTYQKNNAQAANAGSSGYSRSGMPPPAVSLSASTVLASRVSATASANSVLKKWVNVVATVIEAVIIYLKLNQFTPTHFVSKYTTAGVPVWAASMTATSVANNEAHVNANDSTGVYFGGRMNNGYTDSKIYNADGSTASASIPLLSGPGTYNGYIAKYDTNGVFKWFFHIPCDTYVYSIVPTSSGVFVNGFYNNTSGTTALGTSGKTLPQTSTPSSFILKLDTSGTLLLFTVNAVLAASNGLAVDSTGIYVTGTKNSAGGTTLNNGDATTPTASLFTLPTLSGGTDAFVIKYNTSLVVQWVIPISGTGNQGGFGVATDSTGVYAVGTNGGGSISLFNGDGNSSGKSVPTGVYLIKIDNSSLGTIQWVAGFTTGNTSSINGIAADETGVYLTAGYAGSATLKNSDTNTFTTYSVPTGVAPQSGILLKYNSSGFVQWFLTLNTSSASTTFYRCAVDSTGIVVILLGYTSDTDYTVNLNGTTVRSLPKSSGNYSPYALKCTLTGTPIWNTVLCRPGYGPYAGVSITPSGDIYFCSSSGAGADYALTNGS